MAEPSILTVLGLIEQRPSMYLGHGDSERAKQLAQLQAIITGYSLALRQHQVGSEDLATTGELEEFLRTRTGADNLTGIDQILRVEGDPETAWKRVWTLVREFRDGKAAV